MTVKTLVFGVIVFLAITVSFPVYLLAQSVGSIDGTVTDNTGALISGAQVAVRNQGTAQERNAVTDNGGHFSIPLLPIGTYTITVTKQGFETVVTRNQPLAVQALTLAIKMPVAAVATQVSVTSEGAAVTVQRSDATLGQTIEPEQVTNLPLNGRDFAQLALLAPGTARGEQPGDFLNQGNSSEVSYRGSVSLSVQGMSENSNDWRYDGIDDNELTAGGVGFLPQIDAIEEFKVLTFNYSAQYGSRGGSTVLVSTKSGTNNFHGSAFEFIRNDHLDARNYFDGSTKGLYIQNEYGFSIGGPIIKNKTFFFGDYEANRIRQGSPALSIVPTVAQKQGIFTGAHIFNPASTTGQSATGPQFARTEFPNDIIPASSISPVGQAVADLYANPNYSSVSGYNYLSNPVSKLNDNPWDVRIDHELAANDRIFARFSFDNSHNFVPSGLPGFGSRNPYSSTQTFTTHARNMMISETHIFASNIVNQIAGGYNRDFNYIRSFGFGTNEASELGIAGVNNGDSATSGMTELSISGFNPLGDRLYSPFQGGTSVFHYFDTLNVIDKNHSLAFGFDFRAMQGNDLAEPAFAGTMSFNSNFTSQFGPGNSFNSSTGSSIASLLLGLPESGSISSQLNSTVLGRRWKEFRGFIQDDWTVTPRLVLNLGLAYGVTTPLSEAENRYANFDINTGKFYVAGQGGGSTVGVKTDYSNVEPRFGFAYSPYGSARSTVIRGGYAIFHDVSQQGGSTGLQQNPPYVNTYAFASDDITPVRTISTGFPVSSGPVDLATYSGNLVATQLNFNQGLIQQYNVNVQQGTPGGVVLTIAYAGTHGSRIFNSVGDMNAATPGTGVNPAARRLFPQFNSITGIQSNGWLIYNSLQAKAERRATRNLYLLASYTYSQAVSNGYYSGVTNPPGVSYYPIVPFYAADRGLAPLSLRNNFTTSFIYSFPVGKGQHFMSSPDAIEEAVLGDWQVNGIILAHSGFPLAFAEDVNNSGAGVSSRPDQLCSNPVLSNPTVSQWLNTACFAEAPAGRLGIAPRTSGYGPRQTNLDLSAFKSFPTFREQQLQFRAEFFNILNHSQFATPDQNFGDATFGAISATVNNNRQIQFALKYLF